MSDPVTSALVQIAARRRESFVIVSDRSRENLYAQFIAADEEAGLYGELVGNEFLPDGEKLTPEQEAEIVARGWKEGAEGNWARTWPDAATEADVQAIALETLQALRDVYGASGEVDVEVELYDEPPADGPAQRGDTALMLVLILALFGVLAAVILARG